MIQRICLTIVMMLIAITAYAEQRIITYDLSFDNVLGLTSIQDRNDFGDMIVNSVIGQKASLLISRVVEEAPIPITCPGCTYTIATALTRNKRVVGYCDDAQGVTKGFLFYPDGRPMTVIHKPGATMTQAFGVNDGLVVVGQFMDKIGTHGFQWTTNNVFKVFNAPFPYTIDTTIVAINNSWRMVGLAVTSNGGIQIVQGFQLYNNVYTALNAPGARETVPLDINNAGHIVGVYTLSSGEFGGSFLFDGASYRRVALTDAFMTDAATITNTDVIGGRFLTASDVPFDYSSRGFVVSGVPLEPIETAVSSVQAQRMTSMLATSLETALTPHILCGMYGAAKLQGTSLCRE